MLPTQEPLVQAIQKLWFGPLDSEGRASPEKMQQWFAKNADLDTLIRVHYLQYVDPGFMGAFDRWIPSDEGLVALIVLLDQFPRHMFRETPRSFAYDKKALAISQIAIHSGRYLKMPTVFAYFCLMPTMHSEILAVQELGLTAFSELLAITPVAQHDMIASAKRYAEAHKNIITRFGRFPHRNAILGRESTAEEIVFLQEPGSGF